MKILSRNDELSWLFTKRIRAFILFAENDQILLKISFVPILLIFLYLVALNLFDNNQLNSSLRHIIVTLVICCLKETAHITMILIIYSLINRTDTTSEEKRKKNQRELMEKMNEKALRRIKEGPQAKGEDKARKPPISYKSPGKVII